MSTVEHRPPSAFPRSTISGHVQPNFTGSSVLPVSRPSTSRCEVQFVAATQEPFSPSGGGTRASAQLSKQTADSQPAVLWTTSARACACVEDYITILSYNSVRAGELGGAGAGGGCAGVTFLDVAVRSVKGFDSDPSSILDSAPLLALNSDPLPVTVPNWVLDEAAGNQSIGKFDNKQNEIARGNNMHFRRRPSGCERALRAASPQPEPDAAVPRGRPAAATPDRSGEGAQDSPLASPPGRANRLRTENNNCLRYNPYDRSRSTDRNEDGAACPPIVDEPSYISHRSRRANGVSADEAVANRSELQAPDVCP
ncbi:hypothetical protein EVAR_82566_1 [Eumeta japonica]|uniref:Uncharacterized protein n=1 Tax=Eumeta variegata TaxID=151549 RepID=A0A4C1UYG6_EUMVA|nr:hypothetical protein EVAR_82566_1 [Eumeta japonica]